MAFNIELLTFEQSEAVRKLEEGQFGDVKSRLIPPSDLTNHISAFSNADGGDLFIGIDEKDNKKTRIWNGFEKPEDANGFIQIFEQLFPLGTYYQYEFLKSDDLTQLGLVLHVQINKTPHIAKASNQIAYLRRGAQSLPQNTPELMKRLEYAKGLTTFETEKVLSPQEVVTDSETIKEFIKAVIPTTRPEPWLKKQALLRDGNPTVAGITLFSDEPQANLPKHCGVKIYRYKTKENEGFREALEFTPKTIEGPLYKQIKDAVKATADIVESAQVMGEQSLEKIEYPPQTLHEIITNAVIHRDYSIADDIHIRIFDNRVEVQSPGKLPAHITVNNILDERFARNGQIVRLLNKYPDPPNQDVGEGLNTAFAAMHKIGYKEPKIIEKDNSVLVIIKHERLASPEEAIMDYLQTHATINNRTARDISHINADYKIKSIFGRMVENGMIEQVPGTKTSNTAYRLKRL